MITTANAAAPNNNIIIFPKAFGFFRWKGAIKAIAIPQSSQGESAPTGRDRSCAVPMKRGSSKADVVTGSPKADKGAQQIEAGNKNRQYFFVGTLKDD